MKFVFFCGLKTDGDPILIAFSGSIIRVSLWLSVATALKHTTYWDMHIEIKPYLVTVRNEHIAYFEVFEASMIFMILSKSQAILSSMDLALNDEPTHSNCTGRGPSKKEFQNLWGDIVSSACYTTVWNYHACILFRD